DFAERLEPTTAFDRTGDALGHKKPPGDDVSVPGIDDGVDVLVEEIAVPHLDLHDGEMCNACAVVIRGARGV
ncbi:MAG: hypothetical protein JKY37_09695, partial [Nannocystaceae bacterium]|nr:hypothetical protein [Nannocystaceae bacterium]